MEAIPKQNLGPALGSAGQSGPVERCVCGRKTRFGPEPPPPGLRVFPRGCPARKGSILEVIPKQNLGPALGSASQSGPVERCVCGRKTRFGPELPRPHILNKHANTTMFDP